MMAGPPPVTVQLRSQRTKSLKRTTKSDSKKKRRRCGWPPAHQGWGRRGAAGLTKSCAHDVAPDAESVQCNTSTQDGQANAEAVKQARARKRSQVGMRRVDIRESRSPERGATRRYSCIPSITNQSRRGAALWHTSTREHGDRCGSGGELSVHSSQCAVTVRVRFIQNAWQGTSYYTLYSGRGGQCSQYLYACSV